MEVQIFIPLMVAAVQSAGQVLSIFVSKAKDVANKHIFDKEFLENVITDSTEQLSSLLSATSIDLKQEMREQSIIDVVQDLQAHITAIGKLINLVQSSEITPAIAERLITGGLLPLQVSLEKAEIRLLHYGRSDIRSHCHIIGTSALIAGYSYLGQNVPSLQKDLEISIHEFQKRLLDLIAQMTVQSGKAIPWEQIPHLITIEGVFDLIELYNSLLETSGKGIYPSIKPIPQISSFSNGFEIQQNEFSEWRSKFNKIGWLEEIGPNTKNALRNSQNETDVNKESLLCVTYANVNGSHITGAWFNNTDLFSSFTALIATKSKIIIVNPDKKAVKVLEYRNIHHVETTYQSDMHKTYLVSTNTGDSMKLNVIFISKIEALAVDSFFERITFFK